MTTLIDRIKAHLTAEYQTTVELSEKTGIPLSNLQVALRLHMYTDRYKTDPAFYRRKIRGSNKYGYKLPTKQTTRKAVSDELIRAISVAIAKELQHASV